MATIDEVRELIKYLCKCTFFSGLLITYIFTRYRIIALVSVIEKQLQGIHYKMKYAIDPKTDNFVKYYLDNPNFYVIVCVMLVFQD